jgi:site-specific recombinase XerD
MNPEVRKYSGDKIFRDLPVGTWERKVVDDFLESQDYSTNTQRAFCGDLRQFASWFASSNAEPFLLGRVTTLDIARFRTHLRENRGLAVSTVNRALVILKKFFGWLVVHGELKADPSKGVRLLQKAALAPKGIDEDAIRRLLREADLREDARASAIFHTLAFTGCRCGDLVRLDLDDLTLGERSGSALFRCGKGRRERRVPLPLACRRALANWISVRPSLPSRRVFVGCRGPLTERGIRSICDKYGVAIGTRFHPHALRHSFAKRFLADTANDIVSLAQILGHSSLSTTARYSLRSERQLADATERVAY